MTAWLATAAEWLLSPAKRKAFYALLAAAGTLLVLFGVGDTSAVTGWAGLVAAVLELAALCLGIWKARRGDIKVVYAAALVVLAAAKGVGLLTDGQVSHYGDVLNQALAIVPMLVLFIRTDPKTPTGEPLREYAGRHAQP